jgi:cytochrome c-type biogenesis protein CcmH/NrfG
MTTKIYIVLGVVLTAALIIAVFIEKKHVNSPAPIAMDQADFPQSSSDAETPSRENVSQSVRDAMAHLRDLVQQNPTDTSALFELGRLLHGAHRAAEALQYYERGLQIDPDNVEARIDYSLCLFQNGNVQKAFEQNRIVLMRSPSNAMALYNLGAIHANGGAKDSAEYYWKRLGSLHPQDPLSAQARTNIDKLREQRADERTLP